MRERLEKIADHPIWRPLGGLVAVVGVIAFVYVVATLHAHTADINCMKRGFDQVLEEALNHKRLLPPPAC